MAIVLCTPFSYATYPVITAPCVFHFCDYRLLCNTCCNERDERLLYDSTRKKESKTWSKIFSYEASFSRKSCLKGSCATRALFRHVFLGNEASYEETLYYVFDSFFLVESISTWLQHFLWNALYNNRCQETVRRKLVDMRSPSASELNAFCESHAHP